MDSRLTRLGLSALAVLMIIGLCLVDADAQRRKKRRVRRVSKPAVTRPVVTNPPIAPANEQAGEVKILSTADDTSTGSDQSETGADAGTKSPSRKKPQTDREDIQQTISTLSNQVDRLTNKLSQMQENDRALLDMERLTRAEQRAESLRSQLIDSESKLADLQSRLDQVDYALKPENIERSTAMNGSVHPEEQRDARRRQLENEKSRLNSQIKILETSRVRLESAIDSADAEVDLLRRRMESQQQEKDNKGTQPSDRPATQKKPE